MSEGIKIEKNVPIPEKIKSGPKADDSDKAMEIGDSFYIEGIKRNTLYQRVYKWQKRSPGRKFTCRAEGDGFRVWRTA